MKAIDKLKHVKQKHKTWLSDDDDDRHNQKTDANFQMR